VAWRPIVPACLQGRASGPHRNSEAVAPFRWSPDQPRCPPETSGRWFTHCGIREPKVPPTWRRLGFRENLPPAGSEYPNSRASTSLYSILYIRWFLSRVFFPWVFCRGFPFLRPLVRGYLFPRRVIRLATHHIWWAFPYLPFRDASGRILFHEPKDTRFRGRMHSPQAMDQ